MTMFMPRTVRHPAQEAGKEAKGHAKKLMDSAGRSFAKQQRKRVA